MNREFINFDLLFDASEYFDSGMMPWTFLSYPTSLAVDRGLPPDQDVWELIGHLQKRGIAVAIWINGAGNGVTYCACRKEDIQRLSDVVQELEETGEIQKGFCCEAAEQLYARARGNSE